MSLSDILKNWYIVHKRDLPWRNTSNPYHIWISEVILQQTRVAQGLPYFLRFVEQFPSVKSLAEAEEDILLKIWQGLGYYSRARNLQQGARFIMEKFNGRLPSDYNELLKIKGIGEYTASAVASFAFNLPHPVVDGNVNRFISRFYGIYDPVDSLSGKNLIKDIVNGLIDRSCPGIFNQSIMEFGALQCVPKNPDCLLCPLTDLCIAYKMGVVHLLPVKQAKKPVISRYFYYLVLQFQSCFLVQKRDRNDIWKGLYEFPLIELNEELSDEDFINSPFFKEYVNNISFSIIGTSRVYVHKLSHRNIVARFYSVKITEGFEDLQSQFETTDNEKLHKLPVSRLIHRFIEDAGL